MTLNVSYMGTKRQIGPLVADIISTYPKGPLLDMFAGICAIGSEVGSKRQIWCNDAQHFSSNVANAFFLSQYPPLQSLSVIELILPPFLVNKRNLERRFQKYLNKEEKAINSSTVKALENFYSSFPFVGNSVELEKERKRLSKKPSTFPYRLFSISFAGGYLGLRQAIEVDSLKFAADSLLKKRKIKKDHHRWINLALSQALSKVSTTTGHFAQFIGVKTNNLDRFIAQRKRSVWDEWLLAHDDLVPVGTRQWRKENRVFRGDALNLLKRLKKRNEFPSVIYADPPYTDDQYSRYYHLFESLLLYDYPAVFGKGRYRPDRFISSFSHKSAISSSMEQLIKFSADIQSHLVISYPDNGLLPDSKKIILKWLKNFFKKAEVAQVIPHNHSTMGGSKGPSSCQVNEIIFTAK